MTLTEIFCDIDDFCQAFLPEWEKMLLEEQNQKEKRYKRAFSLTPSEVMTIVIHFHQSRYRDFKRFDMKHVSVFLCDAFPKLTSYNRFIELKESILVPLCAYLYSRRMSSHGIAFIDSTSLKVCHNKRIKRHKTFKNIAERGKTSVDWFYGFKLHLIVNDSGELVSFFVTPGNVDDRQVLEHLSKGLTGKLFADKGYISKKLRELLLEQGVELITKLRRNMKPIEINDFDKVLLRKRSVIETINDQLKNISQIEHTRHRSIENFMVNLVACLVAYSWQEKKPSLNLHSNDLVLVNI